MVDFWCSIQFCVNKNCFNKIFKKQKTLAYFQREDWNLKNYNWHEVDKGKIFILDSDLADQMCFLNVDSNCGRSLRERAPARAKRQSVSLFSSYLCLEMIANLRLHQVLDNLRFASGLALFHGVKCHN
jgi:hypothetical protein